jgi:hypothetical protein
MPSNRPALTPPGVFPPGRGLHLVPLDADNGEDAADRAANPRSGPAMRKLLCHLLGRHRPAIVVVGYADDHPVTEAVCPHCGARRGRGSHADFAA